MYHPAFSQRSLDRRMPLTFRRTASAILLTLACISLVPNGLLAATGGGTRVIIVGFDGVDAELTEQWMDEGKLPNLARLRETGTFRPLRPTLPAQTPVSWATFSTGIDPGRTAIFDFLRRDPQTYMPVFAAFNETTEPFVFGRWNGPAAGAAAALLILLVIALPIRLLRRSWRAPLLVGLPLALLAAAGAWYFAATMLPESRPGVENRRQGIPLWDVVSDAGLKARIIRVPVTFPSEEFDGHMISGLGVPDLSGRVGKPYYFTSEIGRRGADSTNEFSIEVVQLDDNRGVLETKIAGPPNKLFSEPEYVETAVTLTVADDRKSVEVEVGGQRFALRPGEWSDWVSFEFAFNRVVRIRGISRFFLLSSEPEIRLYLSPINFDPRHLPPGIRVSTPPSWARELAEEHGPFKTMGWGIDTWAVSEGFANEQMFWDDMVWTEEQFRTMYRHFLRGDDDLYVQYFEFPDRVAHIFYRLVDEAHPAYDPGIAAEWGDAILRSYQMMDQIAGEAIAAAEQQGAVLMVISDHGFATWRRSINYNTWLVQNGYLVLRSGVEARERNLELLFDQGEFWENVDWSKTRAYAMGLGNLYINLAGREAKGIVRPGEEYEKLKEELKQGLEAIVDPDTGERPVSRVVSREEAYRSFDPNMIPDLFITNRPGYRVSWQTSLGGIQKNLIEENRRVWSGDHCSLDPEFVKGIFFSNRKLATAREPYIADIYPTVLELLGVAPPYELDGVALK
jgi:predicted AlkP superfamily phosphohydrolase/phosphomutase